MGYLSCTADSTVADKPIKVHQYDYREWLLRHQAPRQGYVYKAVLRGRHVAVKRSETAPEADNVIDILSKIQSPCLVNLVGFSNDANHRLLVVEFMSNGTLYDVLHSSSRPPNWARRIRLALQTAKAIHTLHSSNPPVIHRDVKSANVLIDRNFNARLGDFGLALQCHVGDYRLRSTPPAGTMGYIDPCYVTPESVSTKADVFSFGILLLEMISGRKAIDVGYSPPSIVEWAIPLVKKGKLRGIYDPRIAQPHCEEAAGRDCRQVREVLPAMSDIVHWLGRMCKLVPLHSWNPCLMVEGEDLDGRYVRRVQSDLGMRNNLMDLMAGTRNDEGNVLSARFGIGCGRDVRGRSSDNDKAWFPRRPKQSIREDSILVVKDGAHLC